MNLRYRKITSALVLSLVFAITQVSLATSLPVTNTLFGPAMQDAQITGILTTQGNKPITVNGASALSGATIPSGASIETPDGVGATINIPGHGSLQIATKTKLTIEIDLTGNIKVNITQGCAVLSTRKGTSGELIDPQGRVSKADPSGDNVIDSCPGVRVAGAAAGGGGGLFGLGTAATVAIIGGAAAGTTGIVLATRGSNPSPGSP